MLACLLSLILSASAADAPAVASVDDAATPSAGSLIHEFVLVNVEHRCDQYSYVEYTGGPKQLGWRSCYIGAVKAAGSDAPAKSLTLLVREWETAEITRMNETERLCLRSDSLPYHLDDQGEPVYHLFHSRVPLSHVVQVACPTPGS